jgi:hypothetical protein
MASAHLAFNHIDDALEAALEAKRLLETGDRSLEMVLSTIFVRVIAKLRNPAHPPAQTQLIL